MSVDKIDFPGRTLLKKNIYIRYLIICSEICVEVGQVKYNVVIFLSFFLSFMYVKQWNVIMGTNMETKTKIKKTKAENSVASEKKNNLFWDFLWDVLESQNSGIYEAAVE